MRFSCSIVASEKRPTSMGVARTAAGLWSCSASANAGFKNRFDLLSEGLKTRLF